MKSRKGLYRLLTLPSCIANADDDADEEELGVLLITIGCEPPPIVSTCLPHFGQTTQSSSMISPQCLQYFLPSGSAITLASFLLLFLALFCIFLDLGSLLLHRCCCILFLRIVWQLHSLLIGFCFFALFLCGSCLCRFRKALVFLLLLYCKGPKVFGFKADLAVFCLRFYDMGMLNLLYKASDFEAGKWKLVKGYMTSC